MKVSTFLVIKAVISLLFGIGMAVLPALLMNLFGIALDPSGVFMTRTVGACLIGIGLICWLGKDIADNGRSVITLSLFAADTLGFIFALMAQLAGLMNAFGWVIVIIWLLLALGNGYCRFLKLSAA
jgi:hypothetical protein